MAFSLTVTYHQGSQHVSLSCMSSPPFVAHRTALHYPWTHACATCSLIMVKNKCIPTWYTMGTRNTQSKLACHLRLCTLSRPGSTCSTPKRFAGRRSSRPPGCEAIAMEVSCCRRTDRCCRWGPTEDVDAPAGCDATVIEGPLLSTDWPTRSSRSDGGPWGPPAAMVLPSIVHCCGRTDQRHRGGSPPRQVHLDHLPQPCRSQQPARTANSSCSGNLDRLRYNEWIRASEVLLRLTPKDHHDPSNALDNSHLGISAVGDRRTTRCGATSCVYIYDASRSEWLQFFTDHTYQVAHQC